ncbi:small integral membrane protein 13 [Neocloeon triangulifer]|uniref:small integral membrane protein 13 n=1 Tax=Neocloeon triangulifer TaxID=2078957 RepID=UPI00286F37DD|nr:small integral membrane protein 13 [Neocloeon triangulifer]
MEALVGVARDVAVALLALVLPLSLVLLLVLLGWYLMWKLFLSRFRFIRELVGSMGETPKHVPQEVAAAKPNKKSRRD